MNITVKKVADLHLAEQNVRSHPSKQLAEMKRSYDMFGQYRPLVVASDGECLVGNGFLEMAMANGIDSVECIVLPEGTTKAQKRKIMLADNKIFDLGTDSTGNIDMILSEMKDFDIPGYDASILEELYSEVEQSVKSVSGFVPSEIVETIKQTEEQRTENPPKDDESKYEVKKEVVDMQNEHEGEPYITCPHCGCKIYGHS